MPAGYTVNNTDLDSIFKLRKSSPGAALGYLVSGVDISNRYEATITVADQITYNTNYKNAGTDLRYVFQSISYYIIEATAVTTQETAQSYGWNNDGTVNVTVNTRYAQLASDNTHKFTFALYGPFAVNGTVTYATRYLYPVAANGVATASATFVGCNTGTYTLTVTDQTSGASGSVSVYVPYNTTQQNTYTIP